MEREYMRARGGLEEILHEWKNLCDYSNAFRSSTVTEEQGHARLDKLWSIEETKDNGAGLVRQQ